MNNNNKNRSQQISLPDYFFESLAELLLELGMDDQQFMDEFARHYVMTAAKHYELKNAQSLINRIKQLCEQSEDGNIPVHGEKNSYMAAFNETNPATVVSAAASTLDKLEKAGLVEKVDNDKIRLITSLSTKELNSADDKSTLLSNLFSQAPSTAFDNLSLEDIEEVLFQMA